MSKIIYFNIIGMMGIGLRIEEMEKDYINSQMAICKWVHFYYSISFDGNYKNNSREGEGNYQFKNGS